MGAEQGDLIWIGRFDTNMATVRQDAAPRGTDSCYVSMQRPYLYRQFDEEQVWTGSESHWMVGDPPDWHAWSEADWYRWMDRTEGGVDYICGEARSYAPSPNGLIDYPCPNGPHAYGNARIYDSCAYNATPFPHTVGDDTGLQYNCVTFDDFF